MEIHVDTIIRLMAIGGTLMLLLMILLGQVRDSLKLPIAGMLVGGATYLLNSSTFLLIPTNILPFIDLFSIITPFWTWLFARRLFERDPDPKLVYPIAILLFFSWILSHFIPDAGRIGFYANHFISLTLIIDLIYVAVTGLSDDLIHRRRLIRIYLPVLVGLQGAGILVFELIFGTTNGHPLVQTINGALIFALVLLGGLALLRTDSDLLLETVKQKASKPDGAELSASEIVLHDNLMSAMDAGQYRETGLTIQNLAEHLNAPEHRLRALVNKKLGHRNFSSFLNGYRISEAKEKLADRGSVDLPILTIAMDLGYNSLAPFNRAFRAETGITPSDYRREAINQN